MTRKQIVWEGGTRIGEAHTAGPWGRYVVQFVRVNGGDGFDVSLNDTYVETINTGSAAEAMQHVELKIVAKYPEYRATLPGSQASGSEVSEAVKVADPALEVLLQSLQIGVGARKRYQEIIDRQRQELKDSEVLAVEMDQHINRLAASIKQRFSVDDPLSLAAEYGEIWQVNPTYTRDMAKEYRARKASQKDS